MASVLKHYQQLIEVTRSRLADLELIESLDELRASADYEVIQFVEQDAAVIDSIAAAQREELEQEIAGLKAEALEAEKEIEELVGSVPF